MSVVNEPAPVRDIPYFLADTLIMQEAVLVAFLGKAAFGAIDGICAFDLYRELPAAVRAGIQDIFKPLDVSVVRIFCKQLFLLAVCVKEYLLLELLQQDQSFYCLMNHFLR